MPTEEITLSSPSLTGSPIQWARFSEKIFLSRSEELKLCIAWLEKGDIEARDTVVMAHLPMVMRQVARHRRIQDSSQKDDLYQEAMVGLLRAIDKFDPYKGFRFSTYSRWWVSSQMQSSSMKTRSIVTGKNFGSSRGMYNNLRRAIEREEVKAYRNNEEVTPYVLRRRAADKINICPEEVEESYLHVMVGDVSLNAKINDRSEDLLETLPDDELRPDILYETDNMFTSMKDVLDRSMSSLTKRERLIIKDRRLNEDPKTLAQLSEIWGVSRERVRQIEVKALQKMTKAIKKSRASRHILHHLFGLSEEKFSFD